MADALNVPVRMPSESSSDAEARPASESYVSARTVWIGLLFFTGYYASARFSESVYGSSAFPSPLWLPDSVLLCSFLLTRKRFWPLIAASVLPIRLIAGTPQGTPVWFLLFSSSIDVLKELFAAWLLLRVVKREIRLSSLREFALFLGIAAGLAPGLSALIAAVGRHALGDPPWTAIYRWFLGDAVAQAIVTPMLLYWYLAIRERAVYRWKELFLLCAALVAVLYFAFFNRSVAYSPLFAFAPVPFAIWAAMRLRPIGTATTISFVASACMLSAIEGMGLFANGANGIAYQNVLSLQLFLLAVSIPLLSLSLVTDERRSAIQTLRESEEKFYRVFLDAGVGMIIFSPDFRFLAANDEFCERIGIGESELLKRNLQTVVHTEDWAALAERLRTALGHDAGLRRAEVRLIDQAGQIVAAEFSTSVIRAPGGESRYLIADVLDVTERKQAEEVLRSVNQRLIEAQEHEAARIARELHDDINQRLALLSIEIQLLRQNGQGSSSDLAFRLGELAKRADEISSDIQTLSHRLHSSKLEYLGIVGAVRGHCRESAEQHQLQIAFSHDEVIPAIPYDLSLCLFRVFQEALRNAHKYSGAKEFRVRLSATETEVALSVADSGVGFNPEEAMKGRGLGLVSMRERLRLVGGVISIQSRPHAGTTIVARVPFHRPSVPIDAET